MNTTSGSYNKNHSDYISPIIKDILLTIITCGIYNFFIQYRQIKAVNNMLGSQKYDFAKWLIFSFITCGLYHVYHEYIMAEDIDRVTNTQDNKLALVCLLLSLFALSIVADALQQHAINKHYGMMDV